MPLTLLKQDITRMETDVIVNAANTDLVMGGGVCGAIFRAAGPDKLQTAGRGPDQSFREPGSDGYRRPERENSRAAV